MKQNIIAKFFTIMGSFLLLAVSLSAEEVNVNGAFDGTGEFPDGWLANRPNSWDPAGTFKVSTVPDLEKKSVLLSSVDKKMHLYTKAAIPVEKGYTVEIKGMVKGTGKGFFGTYFYPMGFLGSKGFTATNEWTEFSAKMDITIAKCKEVRIVIGVDPGAKVEFLGLTANVIKPAAAK